MLILTMLTAGAAVAEELPVANTVDDILALTNEQKDFKVADEDTWLQFDSSMAGYRLKTGKSHKELMDSDPEYRKLAKHSLEVRKRFAQTGHRIIRTGNAIDRQGQAIMEEHQKRLKEFRETYSKLNAKLDQIHGFMGREHNFQMTAGEMDVWPSRMYNADMCTNNLNDYVAFRDEMIRRFGKLERRVNNGGRVDRVEISDLSVAINAFQGLHNGFEYSFNIEHNEWGFKYKHTPEDVVRFCRKASAFMHDDSIKVAGWLRAVYNRIYHPEDYISDRARALLAGMGD